MTPATFRLPDAFDLASVTTVHRELLLLRGADLDVDASEVRKMSGLGLQVLLAAEATWKRDGVRLRLINRSEQFSDALRLTGGTLSGEA